MVASAQKPGRATAQGGTSADRTQHLFPPQRVLMAPGPSNIHPRVQQALIAPLTGHKDPAFVEIMDEVSGMLREVFQTDNPATFALPATGGSGMEASLVNLLEPGDTIVVGRAGFFANRMVAIAQRLPVKTVVVDGEWGKPLDNDALLAAVREHGARVLAVVHGETSTGVEQPLAGLGEGCRAAGAYLVVDAVASLSGTPLAVDDLQIDVCYSGSQKCLSAPPGLAPITVSPRALQAIEGRQSPVTSWYLDLSLHARYWDTEHIYHHTAPVLNVYALRAALEVVLEEGLEARFARHRLHARALGAGLEAMGLSLFAPAEHRLVPVVTASVPDPAIEAAVRGGLLKDYNVEISGGLGDFAGRMWRIGIMGHSATRANIMLVLGGIEAILRNEGFAVAGSGVAAADAIYRQS